jgi:hypothetical protein
MLQLLTLLLSQCNTVTPAAASRSAVGAAILASACLHTAAVGAVVAAAAARNAAATTFAAAVLIATVTARDHRQARCSWCS